MRAQQAVLREKRLKITRAKALYSLLSGVLVFLIVNFLLLAIEHGQASTVIPMVLRTFISKRVFPANGDSGET